MLEKNQSIEITIKAGIKSTDGDELSNDFVSHFTTEMEPLYASVNDVRRRIGAHISDIKDDTINQLNLFHSLMANHISQCDETEMEWRYFANRWVTIMTALILLDNSSAFSESQGGSISKQLGDFSISKSGPEKGGKTFGDLIDRLECELFKIDPAVRSCKEPFNNCQALKDPDLAKSQYNPSLPALAVKGALDPNRPAIGRRWGDSPYPMATENVRYFARWFKTEFLPKGRFHYLNWYFPQATRRYYSDYYNR